jgi:hypothetical protein
MAFEGAMNGPALLAYGEQILGPINEVTEL